MRKLMISTAILAGVMTAPLGMIGCADDSDADASSGFVVEVLDSVAAAVAQNIIDSQPGLAQETLAVELAVKKNHTDTGVPSINDLFVEGSLVYACFDGGLLIYDLKTGEFSVTPVDENLSTFAYHGGERFVGGEYLYRIDSTGLIPLADEIPGRITALCSFGPSLMIGSTEGLYARNILGRMSLLEGIEVSALVADGEGLWIGTAGDGLYRWDGERYRKRYLVRDSSLFDNVTALDFNHNHLYVGTPVGLYVYDGGRWQTITTEQGLPSNEITAIDAIGWVVQIGTCDGLATYFNNEVAPVDKMGGRVITSVRKAAGRIVAGTARHGLILKIGPSVRTLVEPWQEEAEELAAMVH